MLPPPDAHNCSGVHARWSNSWYALGLLTIVSLLNYLDRTLIYILFTPIKKEMAFSDFELALLGTTSFVIFFTALGVPFGRLADRGQAILLSLSLMWLAPAMADVHEMTGPHLRGLGVGVFICLVHLGAYGIGSPLMGKFNDLLGAATNPGVMRYGFLVSPISCMLAAIFLWRGSRKLEQNH